MPDSVREMLGAMRLSVDPEELPEIAAQLRGLLARAEAFDGAELPFVDPWPVAHAAPPSLPEPPGALHASAGNSATGHPLTHLSAMELARRIAGRDVSPVDAVRAFLDRITRLDPHLGAYVTVCEDAALRAARHAEHAVMRGTPLGPLHGVPIAVKDQFDTAGIRTTVGSRSCDARLPERDAIAVARVRAAGAIVLGKTTMTQFAFGSGDPYQYKHPPRNPWDLTRDPYSSSTGSGIAVAAALSPVALGADTGGSIRAPAAANGIVGLRPTWGRISRDGLFPVSWSMDTAGPMARSVEDAALLLRILSDTSPLGAEAPVPDDIRWLTPRLEGVRIGVIAQLLDPAWCAAEVRLAVQNALTDLAGLGAEVEDTSIDVRDAAPCAALIAAIDAAGVHLEGLRRAPADYGPTLRCTLIAAAIVPAGVYVRAMRARTLFRRAWLRAFEQFDVLVAPTVLRPVGKIGEAQQRGAPARGAEEPRAPGPLAPAALAGTPALTVPCGFDGNGMPLGLQILAAPFREDLVLRVGHAYERSTPWHTRRPPVDHLSGGPADAAGARS